MTIPDYQLLQSCGSGAYGEVWIARNRSGQLVALKLLMRSDAIEREFVGLVNYSRLKESPHLIRVLHTGETEDGFYYTMELADNLSVTSQYIPSTLLNVLKQNGRLTPEGTQDLGIAILDGLKTLHESRLIHRDIKPENILYVNGVPKLSDIGLVRSLSQTLSLGGTLGYIPPEHLKSGSSSKDSTDDLYALGKVLYCALTGNKVEDFPSFPPELIKDQACRKLNRVILTACEPEPFRRFKSAEAFQTSLYNGISNRKRFVDGIHKTRYILLTITVFFFAIFLYLTQSDDPLNMGGISQRGILDIIAYGDGVQYLPAAQDVLHQGSTPYDLDGAPRRKQLYLQDNFSSKKSWKTDDGFNFTFFNNSVIVGEKGMIRLKQPLPEEYALRFIIDCTGLNGVVLFRVAALNKQYKERSYYQWSLGRATDGQLIVSSILYHPEQGTELRFVPMAFDRSVKKNLHVEMVRSNKLFRVYLDGKLVLYTPSFFAGGFFMIGAHEKLGPGYCLIRDFEVFSIPQEANSPISERYQLPVREEKAIQTTANKPIIELTESRLRYLYRSHTAGAMAQVFGTDAKAIEEALATYDLWAAQLEPGNSRQPRTRLSPREIETLRRKLSEMR